MMAVVMVYLLFAVAAVLLVASVIFALQASKARTALSDKEHQCEQLTLQYEDALKKLEVAKLFEPKATALQGEIAELQSHNSSLGAS